MHKFLWIVFVFFVKWSYTFVTIISPAYVQPFSEKIKTIHKNLCISLVYIHIAICCTVHTTSYLKKNVTACEGGRWYFERPPQNLHSGSIVFMARDVLTMEWNGVSDTLRLRDIWIAVPHLHYVVFGTWEQNIKKLCQDIGLIQLNKK